MYSGASLVVQWLRLWAPSAAGLGSIPGQGTRSRMLPLRPDTVKYFLKYEFKPSHAHSFIAAFLRLKYKGKVESLMVETRRSAQPISQKTKQLLEGRAPAKALYASEGLWDYHILANLLALQFSLCWSINGMTTFEKPSCDILVI